MPYLPSWPAAMGLVLAACRGPSAGPPPLLDPAWEVQYTDSAALFIGMSVVDDRVVWVSGSGGRVGRTIDGGQTWQVEPVPGADTLQFRDVHAFSADEAFVLSIPPSRIYRTRDGGISWELSYATDDPNAFFDCLSFWDRDRGLAFSDSFEGEFLLIRTDDGGDSWRRVDPAIVPDARPGEGAFAASGTCVVTRPPGRGWFVTGASGVDTRVIRTADYGASWAEAITPIASTDGTSGIFSLAFLDDSVGAAAGGNLAHPDSALDHVAVTSDGGETWTLAGTTGLGGAAYGISYLPGAPTPTLVAVSPAGSAYSLDHARTWHRIDSTDYWTVALHDVQTGWAAGRGRISRWLAHPATPAGRQR